MVVVSSANEAGVIAADSDQESKHRWFVQRSELKVVKVSVHATVNIKPKATRILIKASNFGCYSSWLPRPTGI